MGTTDKPQLAAGMTFTLLGATLNVGVTKDNDGQRYFLEQDFSVSNDGITIGQLAEDIEKLFKATGANNKDPITGDAIKSELTPLLNQTSKPNVDNIKFTLKAAYFDAKIPKNGSPTVEYAFRLDVDAKGLIDPDIKLINIERLTISVWNTKNDDVVKRLGIAKPK